MEHELSYLFLIYDLNKGNPSVPMEVFLWDLFSWWPLPRKRSDRDLLLINILIILRLQNQVTIGYCTNGEFLTTYFNVTNHSRLAPHRRKLTLTVSTEEISRFCQSPTMTRLCSDEDETKNLHQRLGSSLPILGKPRRFRLQITDRRPRRRFLQRLRLTGSGAVSRWWRSRLTWLRMYGSSW